jgi:hypothetical protein
VQRDWGCLLGSLAGGQVYQSDWEGVFSAVEVHFMTDFPLVPCVLCYNLCFTRDILRSDGTWSLAWQ